MYTRIDLLKDIWEYEKEMREYEEENKKLRKSRQEKDNEEGRSNREFHPEGV